MWTRWRCMRKSSNVINGLLQRSHQYLASLIWGFFSSVKIEKNNPWFHEQRWSSIWFTKVIMNWFEISFATCRNLFSGFRLLKFVKWTEGKYAHDFYFSVNLTKIPSGISISTILRKKGNYKSFYIAAFTYCFWGENVHI